MSGLADFITARLGEDEAVPADPAVPHEARYLREGAAKRAILARHQPVPVDVLVLCEHCIGNRFTSSWPCPDIRDLASTWSDHPDYRAEWGTPP